MSINERVITADASADEETIDIGKLFLVLWEHKIGIVLVALIGALLALIFTVLFISPKYRASFTAYVNNRTEANAEVAEALSSGDTSAQQQLTRTYASIITSRPIIEEAIVDSGLDYKYKDIAPCVETSVETNTSLINVYITMTNKQDAKAIADSIVKVAPEDLAEIVEGSSMKIVSYPVLPESRYSPSFSKNAIIGALAGFVLAAAVVIIRTITDTTVKSERDLEEKFGVSVIGTIPNFEEASQNKENKYYYSHSASKQKPATKKAE
ncbi:MAG: hypothetical protein K5745_02770 [Saccharofermentans sp.]|nr:hypothetical protein [Saccharofermentans sp.]